MRWKQSAEDPTPKLSDIDLRRSEAELDGQARAETEAGFGVPIEDVEIWVESWDTPEELPMPAVRRLR